MISLTYAEWKALRSQRSQDFLSLFDEALEKNRVGLGFLRGIMEENPDRVRIGHENLLVIGDLASYCVPVSELIGTFTNPYTIVGSGMPQVEIHPKWKWVGNNEYACIQSGADREKPATDSLASLVLALLDDKSLFHDENNLRTALIRTYGFEISPISEVLSEFIESKGGSLAPNLSQITVEGTHGFVWYLEGGDPEARSFQLSSSYKGGPRRIHSEDVWDDLHNKNIEDWIELLSSSPASMLDFDDYHTLLMSKSTTMSIAKHFAPLRRALSYTGFLESINDRYNWTEEH